MCSHADGTCTTVKYDVLQDSSGVTTATRL